MGGRGRRRAVALAIATGMFLAACSSSGASRETTAPTSGSSRATTTSVRRTSTTIRSTTTHDHTTSSTAGTTTTLAAVTSTTVGTVPGSTTAPTLIGQLPAGTPCALIPPAAAGTITMVRDGRLVSVAADGSAAQCLLDVGEVDGRLQWSAAGDRVLLGPATIADASGSRASGFFADNAKVEWSLPTGKALIAPRASDGRLIWRSSTNAADRLDVTFMQHTDFAAYHPSGKAIAATGIGPDGSPGVFIATNRGVDPHAIALLETPDSTLTEVTFDESGATAYFIHHHDDIGSYHIHRLQLDGLFIGDVFEAPGSASHLTASTVGSGLAWQVTDDGGPAHVMATVAGVPPQAVDVGPGVDVEPIGWLGDDWLVVRTTPVGAAAGSPGAVWMWTPGQAARHVAADVQQVAVRIPPGPYIDPPDRIEAQAPG